MSSYGVGLRSLYFTLIVVSICSLSIASPVQSTISGTDAASGNGTESLMTGYVPEPTGRGTISLLLSCLLTLSLCVWSAVHLNIPKSGAHHRNRLLAGLAVASTGIMRPEFLVTTAWRQWYSARLMTSRIQQLLQKEKSGDQVKRWTATHSFFALSGGFAFELKRETDLSQETFSYCTGSRAACTLRHRSRSIRGRDQGQEQGRWPRKVPGHSSGGMDVYPDHCTVGRAVACDTA